MNYRGVFILDAKGKVFERILEQKFIRYVEENLEEALSGFITIEIL